MKTLWANNLNVKLLNRNLDDGPTSSQQPEGRWFESNPRYQFFNYYANSRKNTTHNRRASICHWWYGNTVRLHAEKQFTSRPNGRTRLDFRWSGYWYHEKEPDIVDSNPTPATN